MKKLFNWPATHRFILLMALAIALGITVHAIFFVVAQVLAVAACVYLMVATMHGRGTVAPKAPQHR